MDKRNELIKKLKELIIFLNATIISQYRDDKAEQFLLKEIIAIEAKIKWKIDKSAKEILEKEYRKYYSFQFPTNEALERAIKIVKLSEDWNIALKAMQEYIETYHQEHHTTCDGCQMFGNNGCNLDVSICPDCFQHDMWTPKDDNDFGPVDLTNVELDKLPKRKGLNES